MKCSGGLGPGQSILQPYFGLIYSDWFACSSLTTNWLFHITEITRGSSFLAQFIVFGLSFPSGWWGCKEKTSKTPALSVPAKWSFSYLLSNCFVENYLSTQMCGASCQECCILLLDERFLNLCLPCDFQISSGSKQLSWVLQTEECVHREQWECWVC